VVMSGFSLRYGDGCGGCKAKSALAR
jgi:hypothetical protein